MDSAILIYLQRIDMALSILVLLFLSWFSIHYGFKLINFVYQKGRILFDRIRKPRH